MDVPTYQLTQPDEIHGFFRAYRCLTPAGWWFRGQANAEWPLVPKAGRDEYFSGSVSSLGRFRDWSRRALAYLPDLPENDWERLAVAQHHGLATCLLDWTENPLVATYFACRELRSHDGAVYCYKPTEFVSESTVRLDETVVHGAGYLPRIINPRILQQRATFTVHMPENSALRVAAHPAWSDELNMAKLCIPAAMKDDLLRVLHTYGINAASLFPDLDGLSQFVNSETQWMRAQPFRD